MYSSPRINDLEHKVSRNLSMVKLFYQNRDYDTAKTYVNEALKLKPHSSEAYKLLSQIHEATGDNALAMEYYKKALELRANSFDGNSSFENHNNNSSPNNRHFTSTKSSPSSFNHFGGGGGWSGTPTNNISPSSFVNNNNNVSPQHSANTENIEQLLDGKITTLLSNFQASVNEKITLLGVSVERIVGDVSGIKKKLEDVQKKLFMIGNKQEEMSGKLQATSAAVAAAASTVPLPSKDSSADVKRQIEALSRSLGNLAGDNSKILLELSELKEAVILLNEKGNFSDDYDEEEYDENDDDYEDDSQQERQQRSSFSKNSSEKPKLGTLTKKVDKDAWNCPTCDTPNSNSASACACCETENPNTAKNTTNAPGSVSEFKFGTPSGTSAFSFGVPAAAAATATSTATSSSASSFSGFNISSSVSNAPPVFGVASNSTPIFGTVSSTNNTAKSATPAASFSFNSALTAASASVVPTFGSFGAGSGNAQQSSSISSTLSSTFPSFGSANAATKPAGLIPSGESSPFTTLSSAFPTFGDAANSTTTSAAPFSGLSSSFKFPSFGGGTSLGAPIFNANSNNQTGSSLFNSATLSTNEKPLLNALLSGTAPPTTTAHAFSSFSFNTSPTKGSPEKTTTTANDDHDEENYAESGTDGDYFKLPDVKLPEKYDQVTGEENEMVSFEKKAKLYIFKGNEYKERGVGILKILTDDQTKKSRVLMRRDHIFKVCLNARLADMTNFEIVDHKFLRFSAIDFSEDDRPTSGVFLLKFGNPDLLPVFKCLVETMNNKNFGKSANFESEQESTSSERKVEELSEVKDEGKEEQQSSTVDSSDEVELVFFKEPKAEHLETVKKLMLPPNFYDYEDKPACPGCIGCNDDINFSELTQEIVEKPETPKVNLATPETSNSDPSSNTGSGLFSSIATDLNLAQNKADTIGSSEEAIDNDHMNDKNFVSEKSKLLPEKFEVKTGEEDEEVLFNERCKIYHYVNDEWKERGVGNMKILKRKNSNIFRLLMRRDKIFNVVCNQGIAKGLNLKPFQNSNNTLTWAARDYSDEAAGLDKLFALKFKTETLVKEFEKTINECIEKTSQ